MPRFALSEKFSDGDISKFEKTFNRVAKANEWTEDQKLATLPLHLDGRALVAFENHEKSFNSVADAFKLLFAEFGAVLDKDSAMKEFYSCVWGPGLDLNVYAKRLLRLSIQGLPSLGDDDRDRMVISQFIKGFPFEVGEKLRLLFSGRVPTLSEALATAKDIVNQQATNNTNCASISESSVEKKLEDLSEKLQEVAAQVASISSEKKATGLARSTYRNERRQPTSKVGLHVRCFNCSGIGHLARNCPSPRINRRFQPPGNGSTAERWPTADPQ